MSRSLRRAQGFTLVELMVALAMAAMLAALAYPAYSEHVHRARRADAWDALARLQLAQERHRSRHTAFAASLQDLALPATSPAAHYRLRVASADAMGYALEAQAAEDSPQASDRRCRRLRVVIARGVQHRQAFDAAGQDSSRRCFVA